MKRKLGLLCLAALALCLALGCASAQTRQEVCSELGVCDYADFSEWVAPTFGNSPDVACLPLPEAFDSERGMTLWQMPMVEYDDDGYAVRGLLYEWFASEGILAQADFDLDGDGRDEWLVLYAHQCEPDEYGSQLMELRLRVYEVSGDAVELADETCLDRSLDYIKRVIVNVLRADDQTLLAYQALKRVDSPWTDLWLLAYANGKFSARAGFDRFRGGDGYDWLCVHGGKTDAHQIADIDHNGRDPDGGSSVEEDWELYPERYRQALDALPDAANLLEEALSPMGGASILADYPCAYELSGVALELLDMDATAYAPDGTPVTAIRFHGTDALIRATASVNLRSEPSLDGAKLGSVTEGARLPWLGETRTDDRGVDWYKVSFEGAEAWISSRYSERCD